MASGSTCSSYSFRPSGVLVKHGDDGSEIWQNNDVGEQHDLAVVDIVCDDEFVAISTGEQLTVIDAVAGIERWHFRHTKYSEQMECLSRLTLVDGKVFVNLTASWSADPDDPGKVAACSEIRSYKLDAHSEEEAHLGTWVTNALLPLLALEVQGDVLVGRTVEGSPIEIPVGLSGGAPCAGVEEVEISGCGWRCFVRGAA